MGVEVRAETWTGGPDARFGAAVAWSGGTWAAAAPGEERWYRAGEAQAGEAVWVGGADGAWAVARADGGWTWGERVGTVTGANRWAIGPAGLWAATDTALVRAEDGLTVEARGVRALAVGEARVLGVICDEGCRAEAWDAEGRSLGAWAEAGEGGAVGEWGGLAWAGDPELEQDDGAGRVCAEDGRCVVGAPGDHLGGAFGAGYAVGRFNRWVVPARTRVVPLEGGEVWALETGAEGQPVTLAGDGATVVVGEPYHAADGLPAGKVTVFAP